AAAIAVGVRAAQSRQDILSALTRAHHRAGATSAPDPWSSRRSYRRRPWRGPCAGTSRSSALAIRRFLHPGIERDTDVASGDASVGPTSGSTPAWSLGLGTPVTDRDQPPSNGRDGRLRCLDMFCIWP